MGRWLTPLIMGVSSEYLVYLVAISVGPYAFFRRHGKHAALRLTYPSAVVHENTLSSEVVSLYKQGMASDTLPARAPTYFKDAALDEEGEEITYSFHQRCEDVAILGHICVPVQSAEACCVSAWSLLKCEQVYARNCWYGSCIEDSQQYQEKLEQHDFRFWLGYGAWSSCPHCYSYHFYDEWLCSAW